MLVDILAGLVCGLLMSTVFLGAGIFVFVSNRNAYDQQARVLSRNLSPPLLMLFLVIVAPPSWGIVGAIAGLAYRLALDSSPGAGLGSSNFAFTLAVLLLTGLAMLAALVLILTRKKVGWLLLFINLAFLGIFGWILPLLASWR